MTKGNADCGGAQSAEESEEPLPKDSDGPYGDYYLFPRPTGGDKPTQFFEKSKR